MSKSRITLNIKGFNELRKSQEVTEFVQKEVESRASNLQGYKVSSPIVKATRVTFYVKTDSKEAYKRCLENNELLKAFGG